MPLFFFNNYPDLYTSTSTDARVHLQPRPKMHRAKGLLQSKQCTRALARVHCLDCKRPDARVHFWSRL